MVPDPINEDEIKLRMDGIDSGKTVVNPIDCRIAVCFFRSLQKRFNRFNSNDLMPHCGQSRRILAGTGTCIQDMTRGPRKKGQEVSADVFEAQ